MGNALMTGSQSAISNQQSTITLALAQVCSLPSPFEKDVADYAAGKCSAIEVWLTKLETFLQTHSLDDVRGLLAEHEMTLPVASYQGGLLASQGEQRREAWNLFERRLELCRELKIPTIVVACDIPRPLDQQTLERVHVSLVQVAQYCGQRGLRAALEFQAQSAFGNNLQTAAAMVSEVGSPHLGICFDAFHFYCGASKGEDLGYLTAQNLFHVQLCDLADVPRELAADGDRILPGDGDIPLGQIIQRLQEIGYTGAVSVELMNPQIWQVPPRQFGEIAMTALRKLLGQAAM
jgi:4-hydroxyphenylpyruvate dioxygenase